jgi:uncharacterized SAM-binding protein YcdF (DUF218 family)
VRLVAVLGYSDRRANGLHRVCAERLRHAEGLVAENDAVLLSGWSRRRGSTSEAALMKAAWSGGEVQVIEDTTARNTAGNAASVAEAARRLNATEVTLVTSGWHAFRARTLVRAALPQTPVRTSSPPGRSPISLRARELGCLVLLPYHLSRVRRRSRER